MATRSPETFHTVQSVLVQQFGLPDGSITIDTKLADLGLDSLACINFALTLERKLARSIDDEVAPQWKTVRDVIDTIDS